MTCDLFQLPHIAPAAGRFGEKRLTRRLGPGLMPDPESFARRFVESAAESAAHRPGERAHALRLVA